jgi:hypothetical protein
MAASIPYSEITSSTPSDQRRQGFTTGQATSTQPLVKRSGLLLETLITVHLYPAGINQLQVQQRFDS